MPRWGTTGRGKWGDIGSWFDRLTTSGWDPVRPEALEGRTGYFLGSEAKQSHLTLTRLLRACGPRNDNRKTLGKPSLPLIGVLLENDKMGK